MRFLIVVSLWFSSGCCPPQLAFCQATGPDAPREWEVVLEEGDIGGAVLSMWGSAPNDLYAVGGTLGNGGDSVVLHYNGANWRRLSPGGTQTYWWVGGSGASDVWMVGEEGRITHFDGESFVEHASGVTATLWGVWASSSNEVWAVGGTPGGGRGAPNDIVLHFDGARWTPDPLPGDKLGRALFKIWGASSEDLYAVGEAGTIWHRRGTSWTLESAQHDPPLATGTLFTVAGCGPAEVYAAGGDSVLHSDGTTWRRLQAELFNQAFGVTCGPAGRVLVVGGGGLKQRLVNGTFVDESDVAPYGDLHGAWADGTGTFWAAGGDWFTPSSPGNARTGVIARYGNGSVGRSVRR